MILFILLKGKGWNIKRNETFQLLESHQTKSGTEAQKNEDLHGLSLSKWNLNRSQRCRGYDLDETNCDWRPSRHAIKVSEKNVEGVCFAIYLEECKIRLSISNSAFK